MNKNQHIYWAKVEHGEWSLYIAATEKGLAFVGSNHHPIDELAQWAARRKPRYALVQDAARLAPYAKEIIEYLQENASSFQSPTICRALLFNKRFGRRCSKFRTDRRPLTPTLLPTSTTARLSGQWAQRLAPIRCC